MNDEDKLNLFCEKVYTNIVKKNELHSACYLLSFFIYKYCKEVLKIETKIIIGWINDGEWDGVASHAWIEHNEKIIDLSLSITDNSKPCPTGDAIILDAVIVKGESVHTYYKSIPELAKEEYEKLKNSPPEILRLMEHKEKEHKMMFNISQQDMLIDNFFKNAPTRAQYKNLTNML